MRHESPLLTGGLRDYGHAGQIGLEPTPQRFKPLRVSKEMERAIERSKELRAGR